MQSFERSFIGRLVLVLILVFGVITLDFAQRPTGAGGWNRGAAANGRFYGKVVDEDGKGVGYAAVQLYEKTMAPETDQATETLVSGQITADNGDFSLENVPAGKKYVLKISFLGLGDVEQEVAFEKGNMDMDLGNITLSADAENLEEVVVTGQASTVTLALDRKVFKVEKNAMAAGGTAEDALKNVPSLSVDIDGNVTLRNSAPQIFVDGRPTTLSLDQIPADAIESVEVVTNPSAKYDASGGQAGIVNIVMKKNRSLGYNGNIRLGGDTQGGYNVGGNLNAREGKINAFLSFNLNSRRSQSEQETYRQNLVGSPLTDVTQTGSSDFIGQFMNARAGFDWFVDNRNTFTITGSATRGKFTPENVINIRTDSLFPGRTAFSEAVRISDSEREFRNMGASVLYKHLFPKKGKELTADFNINRISIEGMGNFRTDYTTSNVISRERQENGGGTNFITAQADYVEELNPQMKLEAGVRAAVRSFDNSNANFVLNQNTNEWVRRSNFADLYEFEDNVYAAYTAFSHDLGKWGYQIGLRAESSTYVGTLPESDVTFENNFPLSLFPSAFLTRKLNEKDVLQFSYSRRINRPNFFQLLPFTDFSDSLNLRRGNANLVPEFTNSLEGTYQNFFENGNNLLISVYYKQASDLITSYQFQEFDPNLNRDVVITSYANSSNSEAYGVEVTFRNAVTKAIEMTTNVNLYNSKVDASNVEAGLINERFTWFAKENIDIRLPAGFTMQLSGEYQGPAAFTPSDGGGHGWRGVTNSAQGYTIGRGYVDAAVRKDLFNRKANLTVSINDIFGTRKSGSYSESEFFIQDSWRLRAPQQVRVNFSYRFGKVDSSLFKRKNNRVNNEGMDMMQ
ncbi:outer membrane beta-barrel protein [Flavilitoribacter nigricans]|uniref:TonB-dependent receptor n=1 Tax=Flavilitoribacter nigricans (strain ATCC 23147 / DSM 23189 / NBRC 102662 / NCIMB 1420 / SS-2) TaxID=1122177 RepID=A0A2D0NBY7_FLAN2|nr:outer membrane beta-barrel protein [Flavilitoribacter nigricans]PHN05896.1 TonB-dependent receptor [Flavilitoribacter nigricans DSM 23189 = NBRC 102662]